MKCLVEIRVLSIAVLDVAIASLCCVGSSGWWHGWRLEDFTVGTLDLAIAAVLRAVVGLCCCLAAGCRPTKVPPVLSQWSTAFLLLTTLLSVYSPLKLLVVSERSDISLLSNPWFWLLLLWNVVASLLLLYVVTSLEKGRAAADVVVAKSPLLRVRKSDEVSSLIEDPGNGAGTVEPPTTPTTRALTPTVVKETSSLAWRLFRYCRIEWAWYLSGFVFLMLYSAARIFIPLYTGRVISDILISNSYSNLLHSVLVMAVLSLVSSMCAGLRSGCFDYAIAKVNLLIRGDLYASLMRQEIGFFDAVKTGNILSRLTSDCQIMSDTVAINVNCFLRNAIMLVGSVFVMGRLSWRLTVANFVAFPLIAIVSKTYGIYYERLAGRTQDALAGANEIAEETLSTMRTVRSFANEDGEVQRYRDSMFSVLKVNRKKAFALVGYTWLNELFSVVVLVIILWYGGHLVLSNLMSGEELIPYLLYQLQLGEAMINISSVYSGIMQAVGASRRVFELIDRQPHILNRGAYVKEVEGQIDFKNVYFSYPTRPQIPVLNSVSFSVKPGECVALVGPSGGGKSSCISLLENFYHPSKGEILLDGQNVRFYDHKFFHRTVALVSQEPVLYARSIWENIAYGLENEISMEQVSRAAELANASQFILAMGDQYETNVGEKGAQLSGGQKQRLAVARALVRLPKVLLLDEATSALDAESEYLVQQAVYKCMAGRTVLLIAHRLSTVEKADRIIVIDHGRVVQEGTHEQLLNEDGLYKNLIHRQLYRKDSEEGEC